MPFSLVDSADIPPGPGPHPAASPFDKRISEALGVTAFEVYKVEVPPGEATEEHDHRDDHVEDVYAIIRGSASLVVDGEHVSLRPGHFVAVPEASRRFVLAGDEGCDLIAICA